MAYRIKEVVDLKKIIYAHDDFIMSTRPFQDFADAAHLTNRYLSSIINRRVDPGIKAARNICRVLDVEIEDIFEID